jgi:hypothetical protein
MVEEVPGFCFGYRDWLSAAVATEGDLGHVGVGVEGEVGVEGVAATRRASERNNPRCSR